MSGYRIPIITNAPDGSLIAVTEGRKKSTCDEGPKLLSVRRSTDGGETWGVTSMPTDDDSSHDSDAGLALGVILTDHVKNIVMVIYSHCPRICKSYATYVLRSYDNGSTWKDPEDISKQLVNFRFLGGPGYGLQVGCATCSKDAWQHDVFV